METENFVVLREYLCKQKFFIEEQRTRSTCNFVWHMAKITFYFWALRSLLTQFVFYVVDSCFKPSHFTGK